MVDVDEERLALEGGGGRHGELRSGGVGGGWVGH